MEKLKIKELEELFKLVVNKLSINENLREIEIDQDMYRFIPADNWQSFDKEPLIGSLHDDIQELKETLANPDRDLSYVDFNRIASVMNYISEKLNPVEG